MFLKAALMSCFLKLIDEVSQVKAAEAFRDSTSVDAAAKAQAQYKQGRRHFC